LIGGWKFQAKTLDDINFSTSASTCSTLTTIPYDFSLQDIPGIFAKSIQVSNLVRASSCQFTLSYSIVLVNDPNSTPSSTILLNPLINFGLRDGDFGSLSATSLDISFATATPDPSPQSTCSLSVPSNISLGNARPDSFVSGVRVNAKEFTIAVNCSKPISNTFIPNVQMTFGSTLGVTCFAQNMATGANAATNVFIDIFRNDTSQTVCPKTATVPTTLVFKQNTTPTVSYSDNLTLRAAFVNANFPSAAMPGIFTTTATFTITFP
jgi:type 1 fimbria pilin